MALVSIIVPVYKVPENYLRKCIESIQQQTMKDIEILLVDDGSPDDCGKICDEYAKKDERIVVVHKENGGVSSARNTGIDASTGKFLMFLDADDWIEEATLRFAIGEQRKLQSDLVGWNHYYNEGKEQRRRKAIHPKSVHYECGSIKDLQIDMVSPNHDERTHQISLGAVRGVWGKLYRNEIIKEKSIRFDNNLSIGEDACFNIDYLQEAKSADFFNTYLNHYRVSEDSANRKYREDISKVRQRLIDAYYQRFKEEIDDKNKEVLEAFNYEIVSCVVNFLRRYASNNNCKASYFMRRKYILDVLKNPIIDNVVKIEIKDANYTLAEKVLLFAIKNKLVDILLLIGKVA